MLNSPFLINPDCSKILNKARENGNIITSNTRIDGFGEQYKLILFTILFAEYHNLKFVFSPVQSNEHNYTNSPTYLKEIDNNMGIKDLFEENTSIIQDKDEGRISDFCYANLNTLVKLPIMDKIKINFKKNKKYEDYFDNKYYNIAIHIRRGNVQDCSFEPINQRFIPNKLLKLQIDLYPDDFYIKLIKNIINSNKDRKIKIHIYSQDLNKTNYEAFDNYIEYHLNEDINKTFNSMVFADTLFMGPSTFSYLAGFFRERCTIFLEYYHLAIPGWTCILPNMQMLYVSEENWYKFRDSKYFIPGYK